VGHVFIGYQIETSPNTQYWGLFQSNWIHFWLPEGCPFQFWLEGIHSSHQDCESLPVFQTVQSWLTEGFFSGIWSSRLEWIPPRQWEGGDSQTSHFPRMVWGANSSPFRRGNAKKLCF
jgi:hypothetical protein